MRNQIDIFRRHALLLILACSAVLSSLQAQDILSRMKSRGIPAYPFLTEARQPNGDVILLKGKGDGVVHWYETGDGYSVLKDKQGNYVYAKSDGQGGMVPSDYAVKSTKGVSSRTTPVTPRNG